jgi:hypothetical protein
MDAAVITAGAVMPDAALVMLDVVMAETATRVVARAASGVVRLAAGITEMAAADSTVVAVADSTAAVAADSTAAAVDTGNSYRHSKYPTPVTNGRQRTCRPFLCCPWLHISFPE